MRDFLEEAEEKMRLSWEQAVPMGGSVSDIFGLELAQSVGNIREEGVGSGRLETLRKLLPFAENPVMRQRKRFLRELPEIWRR